MYQGVGKSSDRIVAYIVSHVREKQAMFAAQGAVAISERIQPAICTKTKTKINTLSFHKKLETENESEHVKKVTNTKNIT